MNRHLSGFWWNPIKFDRNCMSGVRHLSQLLLDRTTVLVLVKHVSPQYWYLVTYSPFYVIVQIFHSIYDIIMQYLEEYLQQASASE
jgi:hypothetical protein